MDDALRDAIFGIGPEIRYVAFGDGQRVETAQRDGIADASDAGSDFFEELLVNPTLLTLARQRGTSRSASSATLTPRRSPSRSPRFSDRNRNVPQSQP
jgi:hypothetical protein